MAYELGEKPFHNEWTTKVDDQTAQLRLSGVYNAYRLSSSPETFVTVNLDGSAVAASLDATMKFNRKDLKGWFTENAEVEIALSDPRFTVKRDAPTTTMGQSSTSSSTSYSVNESLGTFGPTPVLNVGASFSMGWSFTRNLSDFTIINKTSATRVYHKFRLASSKGGKYDEPQDLLDVSVSGQLTGVPLYDLPDLAVANLPIITQAIFIGPPDAGDVELRIILRLNLRKVEKTFKVFAVQVEDEGRERSFAHAVVVPLGLIPTKKPTPA